MSGLRWVAAFVAGTFAWRYTSPDPGGLLVSLNWDSGAYVADLAMGRRDFLAKPWSAHFAIGQVYAAAAFLTTRVGGTVFDGLRLASVCSYALLSWLIADVVLRLASPVDCAFGGTTSSPKDPATGGSTQPGREPPATASSGRAPLGLGLALMALFCTSWVHQFLLLTVEDNLLYLPLFGLLLRVVVTRAHALRARDALLAGTIAGAAALLSLQAVLYLVPVVMLCAIAQPAPTPAVARIFSGRVFSGLAMRPHLRALLLAALGFLGAPVAWCLLLSLGSAELLPLLERLQSSPNPPLGLRGPAELGAILESLGAAAGYVLGHVAMDAPPSYGIDKATLGALALFAMLALFALSLRLAGPALRRSGGDPQARARAAALLCIATTALVFTAVTPMRLDVEYAYLKRFDFLPSVLVAWIAALLAHTPSRGPRVTRPLAALAVLGALIASVAQVSGGLAWVRARRAGYTALSCPPPYKPPQSTWYGRDGQSWVAYFRALRAAHPEACVFVLDLDEISEGRWWLEIPGALWSELPHHLVLASDRQVERWRYAPRHVDPQDSHDPRLRASCAVLSCAARVRLESLPRPP